MSVLCIYGNEKAQLKEKYQTLINTNDYLIIAALTLNNWLFDN